MTTTKYYVTLRRESRTAWLAGPFDTGPEAVSKMQDAHEAACRIDPFAHFDSVGVTEVERKSGKPFPRGVINGMIGGGHT